MPSRSEWRTEVADLRGGPTFPLGTTTVAASAADRAGNAAAGRFTVTVVDTTPPTLSAPPDVTVRACEQPDIGRAVAADAAGAPVVTNDAPARFPLGTTPVMWRAADASGNVASAIQRVTAVLGDDPTAVPPALGSRSARTAPTCCGTAGRDCILGRGGDDVIDGLQGDDVLSGGSGHDTLAGGPGNDNLDGGPGDDVAYGGSGRDTIAAGTGSDLIAGGPDADVCTVGPDGADVERACRP